MAQHKVETVMLEQNEIYVHSPETFKFSYDIGDVATSSEDTSWHRKLMTPFDHEQDARDVCVPSKAKRDKLRAKRKGRK